MSVNCKTPGLYIEWSVAGGRTYATLLHVGTGAYIRRFCSQPIEGGKRRFAAAVDRCMGHVDWTRTSDELVADEAAKHAAYNIPYDCRASAKGTGA